MGVHFARVDPDSWEADPQVPGRAWPMSNRAQSWLLVVGGCHLHVYAIQVVVDAQGNQVPVNEDFTGELEFVQDQAQEPVDTASCRGWRASGSCWRSRDPERCRLNQTREEDMAIP